MKTVNDILEYYPPTKTNLGCDGMWHKDEVIHISHEYADQFKPKWVSVEEFEGEIGQMVLVKGIMRSELGDSSEPSTGLVNWKNKDYSECSDFCYYAMWYTNITEVFIIPKTV